MSEPERKAFWHGVSIGTLVGAAAFALAFLIRFKDELGEFYRPYQVFLTIILGASFIYTLYKSRRYFSKRTKPTNQILPTKKSNR